MKQIFLFLTFIFFLVGCGPKYVTSFEYSPPINVFSEQCFQQCANSKASCMASCRVDTPNCQADAMNEAKKRYQQYVDDETRQGNKPARHLKSFYNTLQCDINSCDCSQEFRACYKLCGGKVKKYQRCVENCPR